MSFPQQNDTCGLSEQVGQVIYIGSLQALDILGIQSEKELLDTLSKDHPTYFFQNQDDHRLGIYTFHIINKATKHIDYILTFEQVVEEF